MPLSPQAGILYIVATPIGNLDDFSARAIQTLQSVAWIAAEDTRHSHRLLQQFSIDTPTISLHDYNEHDKTQWLIEKLSQGLSCALISDAGTPLISDPGYHLVNQVRKLKMKVVPIPGASALITALSASGLPTYAFVFEGFLPAKTAARAEKLQGLQHESRTLIFYESPHRILATLQTMQQVFGNDRLVVVARELTKIYETIHSDKLEKLIQWMQADPQQQKGEFVILVKGWENHAGELLDQESLRVLDLLLAQLPLKQAVKLAANILQQNKNKLYTTALTRTSTRK